MPERSPLLSIEHLTVSYATAWGSLNALNDVSFSIAPGQAMGLAGESGSGKSTIALAILDLLGTEATWRSGSIFFQGRDLRALSPEERRDIRGSRISIVFQDPFSSLNPSLPVGLQVAEPLVFHKKLPDAEAMRQAVDLLGQVGIPRAAEIARCYPHQLSGGMQQRALIATALACEPALLILDEPTTALDVTIEAQILDLLEDLCRQRNLSILFISHNLGVVGRLCRDVCILYAGTMLEQGPTEKVFSHPLHPYTKGLMASLPHLGVRRDRGPLTAIPGNLPDLTRLPSGCIFHPRCPFCEERCVSEPQTIEQSGDARKARCWKAKELADRPWNEPGAADSLKPAAESCVENAALVSVSDVRKEYRLGGFFDGLKLGWSRKDGLCFSHEPPLLKAVDGVSLEIRPGEVLGLVGESGCGKTTLGRTLIRLIEPTSGKISLEGHDISREPEKHLADLRRKAQIVFQNPDSSLNPRKKIGQIIARPLTLLNLARGVELERRVAELLDMVRLSPAYADRYPHQLSGGEKQRVGIARALATSPKFIVCDEAVSALDVSVQAAVLNLLDDLRERLNLAYLFITHDLSVVAHLASRVAVMYRGAICEEGKTSEVLLPPYHPYTEALLSAIPRLGDRSGDRGRIRLRGDVVSAGNVVKGCRFHPRCTRKIGEICERLDPPVLEPVPGHRILCHIPLEQLLAVDPVVPEK